MSSHTEIVVKGARVHNLKNIDVSIPRNKLVVITGLSGSGKSSLAFDTIYAEGQRRYIETFSAYARQFLGGMERPDVDKISGLSPVISIEQKTISKNPRSTVGTITEIYDFLRLLFARASDAYSYNTGEKMVRYSEEQIIHLIFQEFANKKILLLAPIVKGRKGHYRELFQQIIRQGFLRARVDGKIIDLHENIKLDRYKVHDIEIVVDRLVADFKDIKRLSASCKTALQHGKGTFIVMENDSENLRYFSKHLMCPSTGISYSEPEPNLFSFNSPYGACSKCNGLGEISEIDIDKVVPQKDLSIKKGGIAPLGVYKNNWIFKQVETLLEKFEYTLDTPVGSIEEEVITQLLYGTEEMLTVKSSIGLNDYTVQYEGIINFINRQSEENTSVTIQRWTQSFMNTITCPKCQGSRLKKESLNFKISNRNIFDFTQLNLEQFAAEFSLVEDQFSDKQNLIARDVLKEIRNRTQFLLDVGLGYLTLDRSSRSLSGGEAQRIRLATQIGSKLVGVLYILDEPSIGLHQRDNNKLIDSLKKLRDSGNSVIVVEHDKEMILASDYLLDIGPKAGIHGGQVVAKGTVKEVLESKSLTADYLHGRLTIETPLKRRKGNGHVLTLRGAKGNNLKNIDAVFPLGKMICVTGVSGSGKSTLINGTLYPILNQHIYRGVKKPHEYLKIEGLENIDKVIEIDQSPIGRTPRSNPATYTGMFNEIRNLFSMLPEAKIRGYKPGRFSFNTKGGRCETCTGAGLRTIEMNFLPDVYVQCETCGGKRYNRETLEVRFKGKSIADVLDMTVEYAVHFFSEIPKIHSKLLTLQEVGLAYITLGQQSTTLSGGEAQRVKLATELSKRQTGNTFYILDEPTTGLHFEDVRMLIEVLNKLVDYGNTVLIIEHNLDLIKVADHIIDIGPDGGEKGGNVLFSGTPEELIKIEGSYTATYLKKELLN
jgi:excinuclease ABC subunit A